MDTTLVRKLLDQRDALDVEIAEAVGAPTTTKKERTEVKCGNCHEHGHTARNCPKKGGSNGLVHDTQAKTD